MKDDVNCLVKRAVRGEDEAFLQIMQLFKNDLFRTALSFLKNEEEAIEAVQEVTYRAYKNIDHVKEYSYIKTWLIRIMINYCNDQLRKQKREVLGEGVFQKMGYTESHERIELQDAILQLDDRSREILTLKYFHDLKIKEIATELDCPEGTVKTWLNKALKALRRNIEKRSGGTHV